MAAAFQVAIFPPWAWRGVAWIALVPLLSALVGARVGVAVIGGWLFGSLAALGLVMAWLHPALAEYFGAALPVRLGLLALAAELGGGLPLAVFGAVVAHLGRLAPTARVLGAAAAWTAIEFGRGQLPYAMPWAPLGAAVAPDALVAQVADLGGVYAVSFVLAVAGAAIAEVAFRRGGEDLRAMRTAIVMAVVIVLGAAGYGAWRRADVSARIAAAPTMRVALVHAELANAHRQGPAMGVAALERYLALSPPAGTVDLVVWPENAVDLLLEDNPELVARIAAHAGPTPYLVGAPRTVATANGAALRTSALVVADGRIGGAYDKRRLLPFAETMPSLRGAGGALERGFTPGGAATVLDVGAARVGPLICYEAIFPELARATVAAGAEVLVNLSNDSWFPPGPGPAQHAQFAELRAVELRRALVRSANRGATTVVLPDGRVPLATDGTTPGVEIAVVPLLTIPTVYGAVGDAFAWLCFVASLAAIVVGRSGRR